MLKTEDLKTVYLKSKDSKYCFRCWEPHFYTPMQQENRAAFYYMVFAAWALVLLQDFAIGSV